MKRLAVLVLAVVVLLVAAPAAFAYDSVVGCLTDGNGDPWTHGATITCTRLGIVVGTGTLASGSDGCFQVYIGNGPTTTCTFDYAPGPAGDPADDTCTVPTNNSNPPVPYTDCNPSTGTGPNAVTLNSLQAGAPVMSSGLAFAALGLVLAGAAVVRRLR